nr:hypothetical protein [Tanacetum cinerariifolium]
SKGEKIKESKLLIDELDLPCDFLPSSEYDSFPSEDFSRVDALLSTNNEDKVFNPGILIQENPFEIITRVVQDKELAISNASLIHEDFYPPLYELPFFKEVPSEDLLEDLFSNQPSGNSTFSSHPELTLPEVQGDIFELEGGNVLPEKLLDLVSTKDVHPLIHVNLLSDSTTYSSSSSSLLEKLIDELALITFPSKYDDDLQFKVESDIKEIEFLLH